MNEFARLSALAKRLRETYKRGTRIVLNHMGSDPRPIPDGSRGTVVGVDDIGSIMVKWDCGSGLSLIYGEDSFRPLTQEEIAEESVPKKPREFIGRLNRDVFPQVSTENYKHSKTQATHGMSSLSSKPCTKPSARCMTETISTGIQSMSPSLP